MNPDILKKEFIDIRKDQYGRETCLLEEDDSQCGFIFFNEETLLLKFFCTFCKVTYDNINYFCEHLSDHISQTTNVDKTATMLQPDDSEEEEQNIVLKSEKNSLSVEPGDEMDLQEFEDFEETIQELNEAEEIAAEVEAEMRQEELDSCSSDFFGYAENEKKGSQANSGVETALQIGIKPAKDLKNQTAHGKLISKKLRKSGSKNKEKKEKKVTTVKIIAVKNKVAELYEKIKLEEQKRLKAESNSDGDETECAEHEPVRKIIGQTVITLVPNESQGKKPIPYHRNTNSNDCICPACGKCFRSSFSLSIHKRSHYLESDSRIKLAHQCSDCEQLFNTINDLRDHIEQHHYPEGFICQICNKKLTSLLLLEGHMRKIHLPNPLNCKICGKNFGNRDLFEEHVRGHAEEQKCRCRICGRKYSTERVLQQHMRNHKEQIPQCCVVCGKMTLRITQHMKIHTPRPQRVLSCSACGKEFHFSSALSRHFRLFHRLPRPAPKPIKDPADISASAPKRKRKPRNSGANKTESKKEEQVTAGNIDTECVDYKEEEAKRVIVELIQNATYQSFLPDNYPQVLEMTPPIAREETISAVNSIVHDC